MQPERTRRQTPPPPIRRSAPQNSATASSSAFRILHPRPAKPAWASQRSGLLDSDKGGRDAGRPSIMRLGTDDGADQGRNLVDAVRPLVRRVTMVVVLPARGRGAGA